MTVKRRTLLGSLPLLGAARALAQPMPLIGPVGEQPAGPGPLYSLGAPSLSLSFMTPGTLDPRLTFTRASTATYFDVNGVMQTAAANTARWDYDPVYHSLNGLLIEESRTNGVTDSANIGAGTWTNVATTTGALVVAPDGTTTGATLIGSTGAARTTHQFAPVVSTNTLTVSVWLKAAAPVTARVGLGSAGVREIVTQSVSVTTTWQRFSVTATGLSTDTGNAQLSIYCSDGTNPNTINAWGAQGETGAFPTSYIPTTTAAVARSQDQCSILPPNMGFYVSPGGTWQMEYICTKSNAGGSTFLLGQHNNITGPVPMYLNSTQALTQYDGVAVMGTTNAAVDGLVHKAATTRATTNVATACLDAGPVGSASTLTNGYPLLVNGVDFLRTNEVNAAQMKAGYIRRVNYWNTALNATQLQQITTPDGPSLNLSFMTPGTLDPRITFTRGSTATYFDATGTLQTVSGNTPRWDYNPSTHALNGLLIEESRQNVFFPSVSWQTAATVSPTVDGVVLNAGVAPDGTTTATKLIPSGASGVHQWFTLYTGAVSTTYTYTLYVKAAGYNQVYIQLGNTGFGANAVTATFNLALGTVTSGVGTIQPLANGWYRIGVTATSLSTAGNYVPNIRGMDNSGNQSFTGDMTSGLLVWGSQVEAGAFPTSYIPTTAATVTRNGEFMSMPIGAWYNATAGSFAASVIDASWAPSGANRNMGMIGVDDGTGGGTNDTQMFVFNNSGNSTAPIILMRNPTATQANGTNTVIPVPSIIGVSACYSTTTCAVTMNNAAPVHTAVTTLPGGTMTRVMLGTGTGGVNPLNGWMRSARYWPRTLSDAELQAQSTPT